jgi:protein-ribulosamine 3-kinase
MKSPSSFALVNTLPERVREGITQFLQHQYGTAITPGKFTLSSGGCINHGGVLQTSLHQFFIKWNDADTYPHMFEREAKGLALLREGQCIRVPDVVGVGERESYQFIILRRIDEKKKNKTFWRDLGRQVASLHLRSADKFGLAYDNYIGSLRQSNRPSSSWVEFFIQQRLSVQLMLAERSGLADLALRQKFDALFKKLPALIPSRPPALLHGDLWGGNVLSDEQGAPCVIDPAVYFGDAEIELSYTKLFGGFGAEFYHAYHEIIPTQPQFEDRADIYNLYPLLVHLNLFGGHYGQEIKAIVDRFA